MLRRVVSAVLILCFLVPSAFSLPDVAGGPSVSAASAVLMDAETGRVLYAKDADERRLIASTTKIMTALAAVSLLDIDAEYTVAPEDVRVEGSSMYLRAGDTLTVLELLRGLILSSGNDAALALGGASGGVDVLVAEMNRLASVFGMTNTSFANPHGLDHENHYSTARDMAILGVQATRNQLVAELCASLSAAAMGRALINHNRLLRTMPGCEGLKTGYTRRAGRCLVSTVVRDGRRLVAVTLNAPDDWRDHQALYHYGFTSYPLREIAVAGGPFADLPVVSGQREAVTLHVDREISLPLSQAEYGRLKVYQMTPVFVYAPVAAGRTAGQVRYELDGKTVAEATLYYGHTVAEEAPPRPKPSLWRRFIWWIRGDA